MLQAVFSYRGHITKQGRRISFLAMAGKEVQLASEKIVNKLRLSIILKHTRCAGVYFCLILLFFSKVDQLVS